MCIIFMCISMFMVICILFSFNFVFSTNRSQSLPSPSQLGGKMWYWQIPLCWESTQSEQNLSNFLFISNFDFPFLSCCDFNVDMFLTNFSCTITSYFDLNIRPTLRHPMIWFCVFFCQIFFVLAWANWVTDLSPRDMNPNEKWIHRNRKIESKWVMDRPE